MNKIFLLIALILLIAFLSAPVCAYDNPAAFISNNTNLLAENETVPEYLEITLNEEPFHVVKVAVGTETVGLIALNKKKEEIVEGTVTLKQLFTTYKFYEGYNQFKENLKSTPSADWFITKGGIASNIAEALSNEKNHLIIVDAQVDNASIHSLITQLKASLALIAADTLILSAELKEANALEVSFLHKPFVDGEKELKTKLIEIFDAMQALDSDFSQYKSDIENLKLLIAGLDLSLESKKSLQDVLDPPQDSSKIRDWAYYAGDFKNSIETVYNNTLSKSADLVNSFKTRLEREKAYNVLYEEDSAIKKEFGNKYPSIEKAVYSIIAPPPGFPAWKAQNLVPKLKKDWQDAEKFFSKNLFNRAENSAQKAKATAIQIHKQGHVEEEPTPTEPEINYELLFTGGLAIIILLIVLVLIRNRKKLSFFIGKQEEEEESVDIYEWK